MWPILFIMLSGCGVLDSLLPQGDKAESSNEQEAPSSDRLEIKKTKIQSQGSILPGVNSRPKPPAKGMLRSQCDDLTDGGPLSEDGCVTADISCGEVVVGHTIGGVNRYDSRYYERNFCTPRTTDHDAGNERVYRLTMPEGEWTAVLTLDTPCADLDLSAMKYNEDRCPPPNAQLNQCEMWPKDGKKRERVELVSQHPTHWYIVVEGKDAEEGAFALTVQCQPGLM